MAATFLLIHIRGRNERSPGTSKFTAWLLLAASLLLARSALAQFDVEVRPEGVTIVSYYGDAAEVVVPAEIQGVSVRRIGRAAFERNWNLLGVDLPDGLEEIEENAFHECRGLRSVRIPASVKTIGSRAFAWCNLLNLTLPPGLKRIALATFQHNTGLRSVVVPDAVEAIDEFAFNQNDSLQSLIFVAGLKSIGASAFSDCPSLQSVEIPDTVREIGNFAFNRCKSMSRVTIGTGVRTIGMHAFGGCDNLSDIRINEGVESIGDGGFAYSMVLRRIELPASLRTIGEAIVGGCPLLREVVVRDGNPSFTSMGGVLYSKDTTRLLLVPLGVGGTFIVPTGVRSIASSALALPKVVDIQLPETLEDIGHGAFAGSGIRRMVVPGKVKDIAYGAFSGCTALTNIVLNDGLQRLGEGVFSSCTALRTIVFPASVETFGPRMFTWAGLEAVLFLGKAPAFSAPFSSDDKELIPVFRLPNSTGWQDSYYRNPIGIWNPTIRVRTAKVDRNSGSFEFEIVGNQRVPFAIQEMHVGVTPWATVEVGTLTDAPWRFAEPQNSKRTAKLFRIVFP